MKQGKVHRNSGAGKDSMKKNTWGSTGYTYQADETGAILGTTPRDGLGDPTHDAVLGPRQRKPWAPPHVDTPEKKALWASYWDNVASWWESEREQEKRSRWC